MVPNGMNHGNFVNCNVDASRDYEAVATAAAAAAAADIIKMQNIVML